MQVSQAQCKLRRLPPSRGLLLLRPGIDAPGSIPAGEVADHCEEGLEGHQELRRRAAKDMR